MTSLWQSPMPCNGTGSACNRYTAAQHEVNAYYQLGQSALNTPPHMLLIHTIPCTHSAVSTQRQHKLKTIRHRYTLEMKKSLQCSRTELSGFCIQSKYTKYPYTLNQCYMVTGNTLLHETHSFTFLHNIKCKHQCIIK